MAEENPQFLEVTGADGWTRKIAYLASPGNIDDTPGLLWLSGLKSDMVSTKASILAEWATNYEIAMTRFDCSGHGASEGDFTDGTMTRWLEESLAILEHVAKGPQILVGSSMGGWLALLILRALVASGDAKRISGVILIAPAWDMTEALMWDNFPPDARQAIETEGVFYRPSDYGEPYAITRALIEDGRKHLFAGQTFSPGCPIRILQGMRDPDVLWSHATALQDLLEGDDIALQFIEDGEHRLSRPEDLEKMLVFVAELIKKAVKEVRGE